VKPVRPAPPEPLDVDAVNVVIFGTAVWALAFVVVLLLGDRVGDEAQWLWTCGTGFGLGLIGVYYCRRRRDALRGDADRD
jgi:uncharacterized protein DUF2530